MKLLIARLIVTLLLIHSSVLSFAWGGTPYAVWVLPAIGWHPSKHVRVLGELGYNHYFRTGIFYPQVFISVHKNIILNTAYIYAYTKNEDQPELQEHYLMNSIILQVRKNVLAIDNRIMLWNRFTIGAPARHYHRNRFRITRSFKTWTKTTKLYAYDETFILLNEKELVRNRIAVGISCDLSAHLNIDVTYIWQWDKAADSVNIIFITGIWEL